MTCAVPAVERLEAGIEAVRLVLLTKVVVSAVPAQLTTEPETKFDPVTVRVKDAPPAIALEGEIELTLGSGFPVPLPLGGGADPPPPQPLNKAPARIPNINNCKLLRILHPVSAKLLGSDETCNGHE